MMARHGVERVSSAPVRTQAKKPSSDSTFTAPYRSAALVPPQPQPIEGAWAPAIDSTSYTLNTDIGKMVVASFSKKNI